MNPLFHSTLSHKTKHTFLCTWISPPAEDQVLVSSSQAYLILGLIQGDKIPAVSSLHEVAVEVKDHGISRAACGMAFA